MDRINLSGLRVYAYHGVLPEEKEKGQEFILDITIWLDTLPAGLSDELDKTVNYAKMAEEAVNAFTSQRFNLIEAAARKVSRTLIGKFELIREIEVTVNKPNAPIPLEFSNVSVTVSDKWHEAFIAIGSNLGESEEILRRSKTIFFNNTDVRLLKEATLIKTKPYGVTDQPDFINGMWKIETVLSPIELLDVCNDEEKREKRQRLVHWGPRTLDLDIIYYDNQIINTERLTIPHPDMANRAFVLEPLKEVDSKIKHPITGLTAEEMLNSL